MNNFTNQGQAEFYDITRPKYNQEIFEYILKDLKIKENYLDIGCGTGQLTFPLSTYFSNKIIANDVSNEQLTKAKKKISNHNITFLENNFYDCELEENYYHLITIGQALHWFEEDKLFPILNKIMKKDGLVAVLGYTKQHFKKGDVLFEHFQSIIDLLNPYFECDVKNVDSGYLNTNFEKYFEKIGPNFFEEEQFISLNKLINLLRSWSAFYNYMKTNTVDPLIEFREKALKLLNIEDENENVIKYYNFYHVTLLKKKNEI